MSEWQLIYEGVRPLTVNKVYGSLHPMQRAKVVKEWREVFAWLAAGETVPACEEIEVVAIAHYRKKPIGDVGSCMPSVKSAIDGLVDAGVIPDDAPKYVSRLTFESPVLGDFDGLELIVRRVR